MPLLASLPACLVCTGQVLAPDGAALARLLVLAPLLEEWVVRAGLQEWLIRHARPGRLPAWLVPVAVSSAVFGLLHAGAGAAAALRVSGPGLLMGVAYQYRRDWRWCALLHGGLNALALAACNL
jgi:membrane protease YdiL (CAAX protease family)